MFFVDPVDGCERYSPQFLNGRRKFMKDIHDVFSKFKADFPKVYAGHADLGIEIHQKSGPLPEQTRWLLKIAFSAASRHHSALQTHIAKGKEAGLTADEIKHCLLLLLQTTGFPSFMEAYAIFKSTDETSTT